MTTYRNDDTTTYWDPEPSAWGPPTLTKFQGSTALLPNAVWARTNSFKSSTSSGDKFGNRVRDAVRTSSTKKA